jgi:hypothetical protein
MIASDGFVIINGKKYRSKNMKIRFHLPEVEEYKTSKVEIVNERKPWEMDPVNFDIQTVRVTAERVHFPFTNLLN